MDNQTVLNRMGGTTRILPPQYLPTSQAGFASIKEAEVIAKEVALPEILFLTSYPPRECGIATYSQDLLKSLNNKFSDSFTLRVCALESGSTNNIYPDEVKYVLNTNDSQRYVELVRAVNNDKHTKLVLIQHEFGFFHQSGDINFLKFLYRLTKPAVIVFHTVLPLPDVDLRVSVRRIAAACESIVVMTKNAAQILTADYGVPLEKINVIAHGTHLVPHLNKELLKEKYDLVGKKVLSTFGLLSSGKGIETTLDALPAIVKLNPDVMFLVIGKTHPSVFKAEGEKYRHFLEEKVATLNLQNHVRFVNQYLPLTTLLEYLQLSNVYLFTSKDPNQAVSGTFSYAMSCGCPIISTPIPHAKEVLRKDTGIIVDFENPQQLSNAVNLLMSDESLRNDFSASTLQRIVPSVWENSAISHALLFQKVVGQTYRTDNSVNDFKSLSDKPIYYKEKIPLQYRIPSVNLNHVKKMTTDVGIIQFSIINQPDIETGYTLDDNARAMVAMCMHYERFRDNADLGYIQTYLNFIKFCLQPEGNFLNYVDKEEQFTAQNNETNLSDSNGRAVWALGFLISKSALLPSELIAMAKEILQEALPFVETLHSTRTMAFTIKGLHYANLDIKSPKITDVIKTLADRMVQMYRHESETSWHWFESYLTYGNSILPEAMLCAFLETGDLTYKKIAKDSFDFLLSLTFNEHGIKVISNKSWLQKGQQAAEHGEQPIDVAYTILALNKFYKVFQEGNYLRKLKTAFNWFLGKNHLNQIIYNPCTGGCYDGLEDNHVNLNQGSESTVSYLMARMTIEKYKNE
jgi:glycosyltransferase involved in cell wall biosynthesis